MARIRSGKSTQFVASRPVGSIIPAVAGWRGFPRAFVNLGLFGLTVVAAVWTVHQIEYRIEFGSRFGAVMQGTPHRLYMLQLGLVLAIVAMTAALLSGSMLHRSRTGCRSLIRMLPTRLGHHAHVRFVFPSVRSVLATAGLLAVCQMTLYLLQENLESLTFLGSVPGIDVLIAPRHLTVIPLHVLAALLGSWLLWTVAALFQQDRQARQLIRVLAGIGVARARAVSLQVCATVVAPRAVQVRGTRSPRAPPFCA